MFERSPPVVVVLVWELDVPVVLDVDGSSVVVDEPAGGSAAVVVAEVDEPPPPPGVPVFDIEPSTPVLFDCLRYWSCWRARAVTW